MKKVIFICKNVDKMSAQEINLSEYLSKIGFEVLNYEKDMNQNEDIRSKLKECDLIIFSTDKENGFNPGVVNGEVYKHIVFTI